jgi:hypothetical protein
MLRGEERALVAADRRLRGERVHRLRTGDAWDRLHRERDHAARCEPLHALAVRERVEVADQKLAFAQSRGLRLVRLRNLHERVGLPRRADRGPRVAIRLVRERGCVACARLDDDLEPGRDELRRRIRHEGHPALSRRRLTRYSDPHRRQL